MKAVGLRIHQVRAKPGEIQPTKPDAFTLLASVLWVQVCRLGPRPASPHAPGVGWSPAAEALVGSLLVLLLLHWGRTLRHWWDCSSAKRKTLV